MPPSVSADATIRRTETGSARKTIPPHAAIVGTDNCTVAARLAVRLFNAAYQTAYPRPDAIAPEAIANISPVRVN